MLVFFLWLAVIVILLSLYCAFLWRRTGKRSRFQSRLTLLFLAFVLLPTIPLVFMVGGLLNISSEFILLPGMDQALNSSLEAIRNRLEEQAEQIWLDYPSPNDLRVADFKKAGLEYAGWARVQPKFELLFFKSLSPHIIAASVTIPDAGDAQLLKRGDHVYFEHYRRQADSTLAYIGLPVSDQLMQTKEDILKAMRNYATLSLLRDQFLQQGVIWTLAALVILLVSFLAVLTARWTAHDLGEPIQLLTEGMRRVGAGDMNHRITASAKDEIGFLIASFNGMTQDLKTNRENLQRAERLAAWRDVARQVSHEIKNPLTPMQMSLYRLKNTLPPEIKTQPNVEDSFRMLDEEIASMRRLADEFSQFARMPAPNLQPENLCDILKQSARLFEAENNGIRIQLDLDESIPVMLLDREQFRRVIHNVLKNGLEASTTGRVLEIVARRTGLEKPIVEIKVTDHGIGMEADVLEKAFDPYFTTKKEGTGLGLYIVQKIISDHNGEITIQSEVNRGSVVKIKI